MEEKKDTELPWCKLHDSIIHFHGVDRLRNISGRSGNKLATGLGWTIFHVIESADG